MSRFSESMLWPINGKYIRNDSGNCHVVGNDKILVPRDSHMYVENNLQQILK